MESEICITNKKCRPLILLSKTPFFNLKIVIFLLNKLKVCCGWLSIETTSFIQFLSSKSHTSPNEFINFLCRMLFSNIAREFQWISLNLLKTSFRLENIKMQLRFYKQKIKWEMKKKELTAMTVLQKESQKVKFMEKTTCCDLANAFVTKPSFFLC